MLCLTTSIVSRDHDNSHRHYTIAVAAASHHHDEASFKPPLESLHNPTTCKPPFKIPLHSALLRPVPLSVKQALDPYSSLLTRTTNVYLKDLRGTLFCRSLPPQTPN